MAWWRRDPSLWCRSQLHRYSRLGDHTDALLRNRCFSKSQAQAAQHKDDDDARRPNGLSDLQWIQLQHYRRWRRRLQENPYRALFGASEDMLNGKGLKDWEWVSKAFPKWMLRDMGISEWGGQGKFKKVPTTDGKPANDHPASSNRQENKLPSEAGEYPRKVEISMNNTAKSRGVTRTWKELYDRSSAGVASPSDTRRPSEAALTREELIDDLFGHHSRKTSPRMDSHGKQETNAVARPQDARETSIEATRRETNFIKEFFDDTPKALMSSEDKSNAWRQTSIARRAEPGSMLKVRKRSVAPPSISQNEVREPEAIPESKAGISRSEHSTSVDYGTGERFWPAMSNRGQSPNPPSPIPSSQFPGSKQVELNDLNVDPKLEQHIDNTTGHELRRVATEVDSQRDALESRTDLLQRGQSDSADGSGIPVSGFSRSTSKILSQLPEDDLDFLSAEDIRASMGARTSAVKSPEERYQARKALEEDFNKSHEKELKLDAMIESKVINDQMIRRTERELKVETARGEEATSAEQSTTSASETKFPDDQSAIETSIDRMAKWLKTSGDAINRNFWQEPMQKAQVDASSDSFLKGIVSGVEKSRGTMELVREDLEKDLPCSKPLVQRLQDNEASIIPRAGKLARYQQNAVALNSALRARGRAVDRVKQLRSAFNLTEKEYETASKELETTGSRVMYPSKDRLLKAFDILQKNVRLSRRMFFGLQARLESIGSAPLTPMYIDMGHRLLALRDTQFALLRLVERAMQAFGVSAESQFRSNSYRVDSWDNVPKNSSTLDPDAVRVERHLNEEVEAQKSAMQGLSDDGYSRVPKPARKSVFAAESPLAHSLFRPFTKQFEALGKEEVPLGLPESAAVVKARQEAEDRALVKEVKTAYEEIYGPITMDHRQVPDEERPDTPSELNRARFPEIIAPEESEKMAGTLQDLARQGLVTANVDPPARAIGEETSFLEQPPAYSAITETQEQTPSVQSQETTSTSLGGTKTATETDAMYSTADALSQIESQSAFSGAEIQDQTPLTHKDSNSDQRAFVPSSTPVTYTVLTYSPTTDEISVITTTSTTPDDSSESIPVSKAFRRLEYPAKFLAHLPQGFNITAVSKNSLILRESDDPTTVIQSITTHPEATNRDDDFKHTVNPVDGTARLSPTGYVGVDDLKEEVGRELDTLRRREAAERFFNEGKGRQQLKEKSKSAEKRKRGNVLGSVLKTAIVGGTICYIFGVIGEIVS